jgi:hypothetical protein
MRMALKIISLIFIRFVEIGLDPQKAAEGTKQLLVLCEKVPIWQLSARKSKPLNQSLL